MTLTDALAASWVSDAGYRGAWLGDVEARQGPDGKISLCNDMLVNGRIFQGLIPELAQVKHRAGWEPRGEDGKRGSAS